MTKILVIGAGAIGSYYSARLAQRGCKIIIYSRNDAKLISQNGIVIKSYLGDFSQKPYRVVDDLKNLDEEVDYILVATKSLPNIDLRAMIAKVISAKTKIILIQNGIYVEDVIVKNFANELISCIAFIGVNREFTAGKFNGIINHQEYGRLIVGAYGNNTSKQVVEDFINLFDKNSLSSSITLPYPNNSNNLSAYFPFSIEKNISRINSGSQLLSALPMVSCPCRITSIFLAVPAGIS